MPELHEHQALARAARLACLAQVLLIAAGLRHHLVWGESPRLPFSLRPLLDVFETCCLLGFAWFGGRAWWRGMTLVQAASPGTRRLLWLSVPLLLAAIAVPPFLSADVVDYVLRGRVQALHGGNPYLQVAADFPADPFLAYGDAGWKDFPLPYGPVVANVQAAVAWLAHQLPGLPPRVELIVAVVLFKLLFAACLVLAAHAARSIAEVLQPARRDVVFVGVLWSPLLLGECVAQAHNEALMLLPLLVAVRLLLVDRIAAGTLALGAAALAKIVPLALAPLWLVWAARRRRLGALGLGAVAVVLAVGAFYLQFFRDPAAMAFLGRQSAVTGASFVWATSRGLGMLDVGLAQWIGRLLVVAAVVHGALRLWRQPQPQVLAHGSAIVLATTACCLGIFGPWYHVWWVPLAMASSSSGLLWRFGRAAAWLSPLGYVVWTASRHLDDPHQWTMLGMAIVLPAAVAWLPRQQHASRES